MTKFNIFRAHIDEETGSWTRELLGTIESVDAFEAGLAAIKRFGPNHDGTSHNNTMLGDLRVFPVDESVVLSGQLSPKAARKFGRQYHAAQPRWNR